MYLNLVGKYVILKYNNKFDKYNEFNLIKGKLYSIDPEFNHIIIINKSINGQIQSYFLKCKINYKYKR